MTGAAAVEVRLLELPVPLWSRAQQHSDELLREFALAAAQATGESRHHLPTRLTALIAALTADYGEVSTDQEQELHRAAAAGESVLDELVFQVPPAAAEASQTLGDMLDEADVYCRSGEHLLTLASPDEVVAFRRWYLSEFIRQISGQPPVPWPRYDGFWPDATA